MSSAWGFFTEVHIPGTSVSIAVVGISLLLIGMVFSLISLIAGFSIGAPSSSGYGSKGSKKVKVSKERINDET